MLKWSPKTQIEITTKQQWAFDNYSKIKNIMS